MDKGREDLDFEAWESRIEPLTADQLYDLNNLVVDRIKFLKDLENVTAKARFSVGDYVSFVDRNEQHQFGRVDKINPKTIHVDGGDGVYWKVAPTLLKKERPPAEASAHPFNRPGRMREDDWVYGVATLQVTIDDAPPGYDPEVIICMDGTGQIRHSQMISYGDRAKDIVTAFNKAVDHPVAGVAGAPQTLRVEDLLIANLLAPLYPEIELVIAQTPEIYQFTENFLGNTDDGNSNDGISDATVFDCESAHDDFDDEEGAYENIDLPSALPHGYLQPEVDASVISDFFDAAAAWYKVRKDDRFFQNCACIGVTVERFGLEEQVLFFLPEIASDPEFVVLNTLNDLEQWRSAVNAVRERIGPDTVERIPPVSVLSFADKAAVSENLLNEVSENRWRLPNPDAYPIMSILEDVVNSRKPCNRDVQCFEVLCRGLVALMKDARVFCKSLSTGKPVARTYDVRYSGGEAEVCFSLPVLPAGKTRETLNLAEEMALLDRMDQKAVAKQQKQLSNALEKLYLTSNEYKQRQHTLDTQKLLIELSVDYYGVSVVSLTQIELEEILFSLLAHRAMAPVDCYADMFEDIRAFFLFLSNHFSVASAVNCLDYLNANVKNRFLEQLSHNSHSNAEDGFSDADYMEDGLLGDWDLPPVSPPKVLTAAQKKDKKNKRKQSKNARKKNRR